MKATRKLIPAIAMLLISAVMMSTATFAWFSTNSDVVANGMTIKAKADGVFIVISDDADDADTKSELVTHTNATGEGVVIPVTAFTQATVDGETKAVTDGSKVDGKDTIYWATGTAAQPGASTINSAGLTQVTASTDYVVNGVFYIRTAAGFPSASDLVLSKFDVTGSSAFRSAVSVVLKVTTSTGTLYYIYEGADDIANAKDVVIADIVPSATPIEIEYFIYINGEDTTVFTDNATDANLKDLGISMTFAVGGVSE